MSGTAAGCAVFAFLFSSAMAGSAMHPRLVTGPLAGRALAVLRRSIGVVAAMAGIMLVLLTVSQKRDFDAADRDVRHLAAAVTGLDHDLRRAGPQAAPARAYLFRYAARTMKDVWPDSGPPLGPGDGQASRLFDSLEDAVDGLQGSRTVAPDPAMLEVDAQAREGLHAVAQARATLDEHAGRAPSPWTLAVLAFWLMLTFASFGLGAPRTPLVLGIIGLGAMAIAGGVFLMVEYADPYDGIIIVSSEPMQDALFALAE